MPAPHACLQYLDSRGGMMDAICAVGSAPDASVAELTQAAMVAWAETMVRHSGSSSSSGGSRGSGDGRAGGSPPQQQAPPERVRMGLDSDGNIVAGLASWDAASRLFATGEQARQLLAASGGGKLDFTMRLKNFEILLE
jgi:hypothetical protein